MPARPALLAAAGQSAPLGCRARRLPSVSTRPWPVCRITGQSQRDGYAAGRDVRLASALDGGYSDACAAFREVCGFRQRPERSQRSRRPTPRTPLVDAIRTDTLTAVAEAQNVARIVLAVDQPWTVARGGPARPRAATRASRSALRTPAPARWPADGVAALVGDLPALRPHELAAALADAAGHPRAFVAGRARHRHDAADRPSRTSRCARVRPGLRRATRSPCGVGLPAAPGLRHDVDTAEDLPRSRATSGSGHARRCRHRMIRQLRAGMMSR